MLNILHVSKTVFLQKILLVCLYLVLEDKGSLLCLSHLDLKPHDKIWKPQYFVFLQRIDAASPVLF